uniref:Uncharacterized protein n=1 Tax=Avena sativa TaxID=4498 RepID=A0ACD5USB2_AVESA
MDWCYVWAVDPHSSHDDCHADPPETLDLISKPIPICHFPLAQRTTVDPVPLFLFHPQLSSSSPHENQPTMASWDALRLDVALGILARLPPSSVHRCRRVCRGWRSLVDHPHFLTLFKERHRRRARMPLFFFRRNFNLDDHVPEEHQRVARMDLQAVDMATCEAHTVARFHDVLLPEEEDEGVFHMDLEDIMYPDSVFQIQASCDGLLLLSHHESLYPCNPTTGQWTILPPLDREQVIVGFYSRDLPTDGQKVYRILPLSHGAPVALDGILRRGLSPAYEAPPVTIKRILHWIPPYFGLDSMLVVFDTLQERFGSIRSPRRTPLLRGFQLMELDGRLALACRSSARTLLEIWVHQNQGKDEWTLRHRIQLPEAATLNNLGYDQLRSPPAYVVSDDLDVLIPCPYSLIHCSSDGDERQRYQRLRHWVMATPHTLDENFTAHSLFLLPLVNHEGEPPFVFTAAFGDN